MPSKEKPKKEKTKSLTIAVAYSSTNPTEVREYDVIRQEAKNRTLKVTDYLRRLCRVGRAEVKKDESKLWNAKFIE